ncbi:MAG: DUF3179 domain-containing protein [Candidatus Kaiserbacteria bacterium]|nr:DUF3179 domain-containing protein [Candidatus Kaiserbacteria bacterium]
MRKGNSLAIGIFFALCVGVGLFLWTQNSTPLSPENPGRFAQYDLATDTTLASINLNDVLSGGVRKDGIPAITDPVFLPLAETDVRESARGILVQHNGMSRFYPYSILVWHEIVNDTLDDLSIAVTYCPLCDSALVFDRLVQGTLLQFGVSGLLFESNLLMYDTATESLWSQSNRRSVVGTYTGTELSLVPFQVLRLSEVREKYPTTEVLSTDTGYARNYGDTPYDGYTDTEQTLFPISITDKRFPAKDIFYVIPFRGRSLAARYHDISEGTTSFSVDSFAITITRDGDEIVAQHGNELLPGYFELWFSWAVHHQDDGVVLRQ